MTDWLKISELVDIRSSPCLQTS